MLHSNDEVIRFLIFDNNDNLRMKPTDEPEKHESHVAGYLNAYQVGHAEGNVTKTEILDITNVKRKELHDYSFSRFVSTGSDSFLFEATDDDDQDLLIEVKF